MSFFHALSRSMVSVIMPFFLLGITECSTFRTSPATKEGVIAAAKQLVTKRESWTGQVNYWVMQEDDGSWRVTVDEIAPPPANHPCLLFVPGTRRNVLFTRTGKLVSYDCIP
jgi:hypothetical protein